MSDELDYDLVLWGRLDLHDRRMLVERARTVADRKEREWGKTQRLLKREPSVERYHDLRVAEGAYRIFDALAAALDDLAESEP